MQSYIYDSFGNIAQQTGTLSNPYTYTARELDSESGLYFYRARYYDSSIGRFLHEDPLRFIQSNLNLYNYVSNRPMIKIDPFGLWECGFGTCNGFAEEKIGENLKIQYPTIPDDLVSEAAKAIRDKAKNRNELERLATGDLKVGREIWNRVKADTKYATLVPEGEYHLPAEITGAEGVGVCPIHK